MPATNRFTISQVPSRPKCSVGSGISWDGQPVEGRNDEGTAEERADVDTGDAWVLHRPLLLVAYVPRRQVPRHRDRMPGPERMGWSLLQGRRGTARSCPCSSSWRYSSR